MDALRFASENAGFSISSQLANQRIQGATGHNFRHTRIEEKARRTGATNTDTALTNSRPKEATMARQQRSTTFTQESTRPISRVALYARVSTLNNQDPEMQLTELREYAGRRSWEIVEEFTDQGVSGCKESRPAFNRLMSDACRRRFDAVLVWKIGFTRTVVKRFQFNFRD